MDAKPVRAEIVDNPEDLERVRRLAYIMDNWIRVPGTNYRVGLDGLIGLLPGFGDAIGLIASAFIVITAAQARVPKIILVRMVMNVLIESIVGLIPFLGDMFDFVWKSNMRNLALLEAALVNRRQTKRHSALVVAGVVMAFLAIGALVVGTLVLIFRALVRVGQTF